MRVQVIGEVDADLATSASQLFVSFLNTGYLYTVLFFCPYALVPAVVVQEAVALSVERGVLRGSSRGEWEWE